MNSAAIKKRAAKWLAQGFVPVPVGQIEWLWMRLLFAPMIIWAIWDYHPYVHSVQTHPVGLAIVFDLTWLHEPWVRPLFVALAVPAVILYLLGMGMPVALGVLALVNILPRTLANSQGHINHSHQIVSVVILTQFAVAVWWWWRQRRHPEKITARPGLSAASYYVYFSQGIIAGTYMVAALSKFLNSKGMWVWNAPYISFDLVKSQRQEYYKLLEDPALLHTARAAEWVVENPMLARVAFGGSFLLEALAIVALKNRSWAFWTGIALIALHRGILAVMNLHFYNNELLLLIFYLNLPFWCWWAWQKARGRAVTL